LIAERQIWFDKFDRELPGSIWDLEKWADQDIVHRLTVYQRLKLQPEYIQRQQEAIKQQEEWMRYAELRFGLRLMTFDGAETQRLREAEERYLREVEELRLRREVAEQRLRREAEEQRLREAEAGRRREAEELRRREAEELRREAEELRRREAEELRRKKEEDRRLLRQKEEALEELRRREAEELRRKEEEVVELISQVATVTYRHTPLTHKINIINITNYPITEIAGSITRFRREGTPPTWVEVRRRSPFDLIPHQFYHVFPISLEPGESQTISLPRSGFVYQHSLSRVTTTITVTAIKYRKPQTKKEGEQ
jgi:hypothetical protein